MTPRITALARESLAFVFGDAGGAVVGLAAYTGNHYDGYEELPRERALELYLELLSEGYVPVPFGQTS